MDHFDSTCITRLCNALHSIEEDALPRWGTLTKSAMINHFIWMLRHSMGRSFLVPDYSTFLSRTLSKKLVLSGVRALPKNRCLPAHLCKQGISDQETGDLETLQALMEEYLDLVQTGDLEPAPHPRYGRLTIDEWDRLHMLHFEHHLQQFNRSMR